MNIFKKRFYRSQEAVYLTAQWFQKQGIKDIIIPKFTVAKDHKDWKKHTDNGDLIVQGKRIEVKGLNKPIYNFTRTKPYPRKTWIVCAKHSFDMAEPTPYIYIIWNKQRTHFGYIKTETKKDWKTFTMRDPDYKNESGTIMPQVMYIYDTSKVKIIKAV